MALDVLKAVRQKVLSDLLLWEVDPIFTRENLTLLAGSGAAREVDQFVVLGGIEKGTATAAAKAGNTGNGVCTPDATTPVLPGAKTGTYSAVCTVTATNGGTFRIYDPNGRVLGDIAVGATFADQIKFVIADGTNDFALGDTIYIAVVSVKKYVALDITKTDGSQIASAVALFKGKAPDGTDDAIASLARGPAAVRAGGLVWPAGITDTQKSIATAQLADVGIIVRTDG